MQLLLASASPRRADLLRSAGYRFAVRAVDLDEQVRPGESPHAYVQRLASAKSAAVHDAMAEGLVTLGADTAVVVDSRILGKPATDAEAADMLRALAGRSHEVLTGVSVRSGCREERGVERTVVVFAPLGNEDIAWHVQSGEGFDKAGGYAIQGLASRFVVRIEGSYSNVVGLPVAAVANLITRLTGAGLSAADWETVRK